MSAVVDTAAAGNGTMATGGLLKSGLLSASPWFDMSPLELDGYLTGVLVAPNLIPPTRWMAALWGDDEQAFDDPSRSGSLVHNVLAPTRK